MSFALADSDSGPDSHFLLNCLVWYIFHLMIMGRHFQQTLLPGWWSMDGHFTSPSLLPGISGDQFLPGLQPLWLGWCLVRRK